MKTITIAFDGYYKSFERAPQDGGLYTVYAATENNFTKLLYIGESDNVLNCLQNNEKLSEWESALDEGEFLAYTFAFKGDADDRKRIAAVLINNEKPVCNTDYIDDCPFPNTMLIISGNKGLLKLVYTHKKTS